MSPDMGCFRHALIAPLDANHSTFIFHPMDIRAMLHIPDKRAENQYGTPLRAPADVEELYAALQRAHDSSLDTLLELRSDIAPISSPKNLLNQSSFGTGMSSETLARVSRRRSDACRSAPRARGAARQAGRSQAGSVAPRAPRCAASSARCRCSSKPASCGCVSG